MTTSTPNVGPETLNNKQAGTESEPKVNLGDPGYWHALRRRGSDTYECLFFWDQLDEADRIRIRNLAVSPVVVMCDVGLVVARAELPITAPGDLLDLAEATEGELKYGQF